MKLYYFIGWLTKPLMIAGFFLYSLVTRTSRVRLVVRNQTGQILLVKPWLERDIWSLPGGGIDRGEAPESAACRELQEETGITVLPGQVHYALHHHKLGHDEIIFTTEPIEAYLPDKLPRPYEIKEAAWFDEDKLPKLGPLARQVMPKIVAPKD